jgi:uncharacterized membrane protein
MLALFCATIGIMGLVFALAPGSVSEKTHAFLHGVCAQRPSHSFRFGNEHLPLDARMTGIYLGAATTLVWLAAVGRLRASRWLSRSMTGILAGFIVVMAVDGFNALLVDLSLWHPYEPTNGLRLATGILAGTALGVVIGHLFATSMWASSDRERPVARSVGELLAPIGIAAALGLLAATGLPVLHAPIAIGLVLASVGVFWVLGMTLVALLTARGWSARASLDLVPVGLAAMVGAVGVVGALAAIRFIAERYFGLPHLT